MDTRRMEAFSDGVIAILITIMVLELKVPEGVSFSTLRPLLPVVLSYLLSFVYLAIYWTNHHHMLQVTEKVTGSVLWANLHLLFWLSLIPFTTAWMGENHFATAPSALYGAVLFMAAIAYLILQQRIPRWTREKRPTVDGAKPANGVRRDVFGFYSSAASRCKPALRVR